MKRNTYWKKNHNHSCCGLCCVTCSYMFPVIVSVVGMWSLVMMYRYSIGLMHRHAKIRIKGILIMAVPELL